MAHVIMNRVACKKGEWKNLNTVTAVITKPWQFSCYTQEEPQYTNAMKYLKKRKPKNKKYEDLIKAVMPIYNKSKKDIT